MELLSIHTIRKNEKKIVEINQIIQSIYRLVIYSRHHSDDDLLDIYLQGIHNLKELVSIKNAQMEAQNEEELKTYLINLKTSLDFVIQEVVDQQNFNDPVQLFQLLRLISPETNSIHPNRFRDTFVQVGAHVCPDPKLLQSLVHELFFNMKSIDNPIIRAIYFHHELIRIHPFVDGNGRVTRIAKNWMLMYDLYPPIFIVDSHQKKEYIDTLSNSFNALAKNPSEWNPYTEQFFEQELDRLVVNAKSLYDSIDLIGSKRQEHKNQHQSS
jgi:Fic family protein